MSLFRKNQKGRGDIREILQNEYNCIIKGTKYPKQIFEGKISNVLFENCTFSNITFESIELENVIFYNCNFWMCNFNNVVLKYMKKLVFDRCDISMSKIKDSHLSGVWIFDSILNIVEFNHTDLFNGVVVTTSFKQVRFTNKSSIEGLNIIRPIGWFDIEFDNNAGIIKTNQKTLISKFDYKEKTKDDTEDFKVFNDFIPSTSEPGFVLYKSKAVGQTFLNIANQFKINNLDNKYGKYYYIGKREIHKKLIKWDKAKSFIALITCGYGEKWQFGLYTSVASIIGTAFLYMLNGISVGVDKVIKYDIDISVEGLSITWEKIYDFGYSLYFSMMTFTTVGYGNIQAMGKVSHIASFIQMYFGVIFIAIITGSILRKMFR
ncbi:MAG: pentapeptide repeat-containing protein [Peptostreptococcaceae bacterium]|nr:pentapeptide repeat-containing protein [Peptostreptococcaceae bacterium]